MRWTAGTVALALCALAWACSDDSGSDASAAGDGAAAGQTAGMGGAGNAAAGMGGAAGGMAAGMGGAGGTAVGTAGGAAGAGGASAGCADGALGMSGLGSQCTLGSLSAAQAEQLCGWARSLPGVGEEMDCGGGWTVTVEVDSQCQPDKFAGCAATVAQAEACFTDNLDRPCELVLDSCFPLLECAASLPDFTCDSGQSIPGAFVCDGEPDCLDGSDEQGC